MLIYICIHFFSLYFGFKFWCHLFTPLNNNLWKYEFSRLENQELRVKVQTLEEKTTCAEEKGDNGVASHNTEKNENTIPVNEQAESALESSQEHIKRYD